MHLLPQLGQLERRFPDELVVIGVHSPKYPAERTAEGLRAAVQRNEIDHPVINDAEMDLWSRYAVRAWPTLLFIDAEGRVVGKHEGEATAEELTPVAQRLIAEAEAKGLMNRNPIPGLTPIEPPEGVLAFPGKLLADPDNGRLFIADSGHNQIVVTALDGSDAWVIGSGEASLRDGSTTEAAFHHPLGLALDGEILYVADTRNHALRRVDLSGRRVETLAGTGELGHSFMHEGQAREVALRSPWDLALAGSTLYIAMAGTHQLWALNLAEEWLRPYAGTGHEGIRDAELRRAWFAQPSGIAVAPGGRLLYVADSETSAIRAVDLPPGQQVRTLVGTGLFDFGDTDGVGERVRLQHPLGVADDETVVYIADSYNHKIKRLSPGERRCETWLGDGEPGDRDGIGTAARFHEPSGLALAGDRLYIADTNNHAIRVADVQTGEVTTLELKL